MLGADVGPYRVTAEIGSGGMGTVYLAERAGERLALKVVHPHLCATPEYHERFLREGDIGRRIRHVNVVATHDVGAAEIDGRTVLYLAMEYVEGQTLQSLLAELERVPEELCRHIAREVAKGLAAIHAAGVIHRDVKPENVLITRDHGVKLMDLGVARLQDEAARLSRTGAFVGTIHYAAPECFLDGGSGVDGRADLHALGLVLYELASGVNPYLADDVPQTLDRILRREPRRLGEIHPQLSPFFEEVVHCLLEKRPQDRIADADTLVAVLEQGESSAWWVSRARSIRATTHRPLRRIRIPRETAVYGREAELAKLAALFELAQRGEGQVVLIEGEAGIGKSRVIDELLIRLQRDGAPVHVLCGSYPPGGAATAAGAFCQAYREHLGEAGSARHMAQAPGLVPAFDALLRGEPAPMGAVALTKESISTCFVQATRSLAAECPTVLLIDDLHFAPDEARALFTSLAMAAPGHRFLLVGTTRPGIDEKWLADLARLPHTSRMALQRLGPKDLGDLLRDSFRSERLAQALALQVGQKSDGNPFFAFEIIRGLREGQYITQKADGTWISTRVIDEIRIPSSVLDLVRARVADLSEAERDLLDMAACCGFEFDPALVAEAVGAPLLPTLKAFGQIERRHRLVRASGRCYAFDHHQVQEALYTSIFEQVRELYHAALATALEARAKAAGTDPATLDGALCVDLCEHFLKGARGESALRYLGPAQRHLARGHVVGQLIGLTERALAVPGLLVGVERVKTLLVLAEALDKLGRRPRQEECAREAERLAGELGADELRGQAARAVGWLFQHTGRPDEAEAAYRRALEAARACGDRKAEAIATGSVGHILYFFRGRIPEAKECYEQALALARESGDRALEATASGLLGNVSAAQGRNAEAIDFYRHAIVLYRELGFPQNEATILCNLAGVTAAQGRPAEALDHFERTLSICREVGYRQIEAVALVNLGPLRRRLGDAPGAHADLEAAVALSREIGARYPEGYGLLRLGELAGDVGDFDLARRYVEQSLALRREIGHGDGIADSLLELGELLLHDGRPTEARSALEEALAYLRERGQTGRVAEALCLLARLPGGDPAAARAALAEAGGSVAKASWTHLQLWRATGDVSLLVEAKRLIDEELAPLDDASRARALTNSRANREILEACAAHGIA